MSNNSITLTIEEALKRKESLLEDCKILAKKFSQKLDEQSWRELEKAELNLSTIHLALLTVNEQKGNNSRIKERELLIKKIDALNKALENVKKKKTKLGNLFNDWKNKIKGLVNIRSIKKKIQLRVDQLTKELETFNRSNSITIVLI